MADASTTEISILSRYTGQRIAGGEYASLRECVIALVKARAYLARANLAGANFAGAYLAGADLAGADLAGANLAGANFAGADLAGANLAGANFAGANFAGANFAGANFAGAGGIVELPVGDPRGYRCFAIQQVDGSWRVFAGCRGPLTGAQAREHWGSAYTGDREIGDRYLRALRWLGLRLKAERVASGAEASRG